MQIRAKLGVSRVIPPQHFLACPSSSSSSPLNGMCTAWQSPLTSGLNRPRSTKHMLPCHSRTHLMTLEPLPILVNQADQCNRHLHAAQPRKCGQWGITNRLCPLPHRLCPLPHRLCPLPHRLCPFHIRCENLTTCMHAHQEQWKPRSADCGKCLDGKILASKHDDALGAPACTAAHPKAHQRTKIQVSACLPLAAPGLTLKIMHAKRVRSSKRSSGAVSCKGNIQEALTM